MHVDFKVLQRVCPKRKPRNICDLLKYYDCAEHQCPFNAEIQSQTIAQKTQPETKESHDIRKRDD